MDCFHVRVRSEINRERQMTEQIKKLETYEEHLDLDYYIDDNHWNSDVNRHLDKV